MTEKELLHLIDLYFEGETTLEQERRLRRALPMSDSANPRVEEALAVMSLAAVDGIERSRRAVRPRRRPVWQPVAAAAVVAALLTVGVWFGHAPRSGYSSVIACVESTDPGVVMALMDAQLSDMGEASEVLADDIRADFALIGDAADQQTNL